MNPSQPVPGPESTDRYWSVAPDPKCGCDPKQAAPNHSVYRPLHRPKLQFFFVAVFCPVYGSVRSSPDPHNPIPLCRPPKRFQATRETRGSPLKVRGSDYSISIKQSAFSNASALVVTFDISCLTRNGGLGNLRSLPARTRGSRGSIGP